MKIIIIILNILFFTYLSYSQNLDSAVISIDIKAAEINSSMDFYKVVQKDIHGESVAAKLIGYFKKKDLLKIKMIWYSTSHQLYEYFYLSDKHIILVRDTDYIYKTPIELDSAKKINYDLLLRHVNDEDKKVVNEYYFDKFKVIKWLENGRTVKDDSKTLGIIEIQTAIQLKSFRKYLKMSKKVIKLKR
jgi:hypothetical protein